MFKFAFCLVLVNQFYGSYADYDHHLSPNITNGLKTFSVEARNLVQEAEKFFKVHDFALVEGRQRPLFFGFFDAIFNFVNNFFAILWNVDQSSSSSSSSDTTPTTTTTTAAPVIAPPPGKI